MNNKVAIFAFAIGTLLFAAFIIVPFNKKSTTSLQNKGSAESNSANASNEAGAPTAITMPSPTPDRGPGTYACAPTGSCSVFANPSAKECPKTYADRNCLNECGDKANWCKK